MEFMLLFVGRKDAPAGGPEHLAEMKSYSGELASQGKLRIGAPLCPEAEGARIRVRGGKVIVTDGPFAESKEVLGGFWIVEAASREEAIEIARRCPHARRRHRRGASPRVPDGRSGSRAGHALSLCVPRGLAHRRRRPHEAARDARLHRDDEAGGPLPRDGARSRAEPRPAKVETRSGKLVVTDGPFAEAKEIVGGYAVLRAASRAEAIEIAKRYPHAKWGPVELREIPFFDPT